MSAIQMDNQSEQAFDAVRADFPAVQRWTYTDVSGRGILSNTVRAAINVHLDERMYDGGDKAAMFRMIEAVRGKFARLVNADADEIAYTKNISEGLNIVANSVAWEAGDNVVLCPDLEHPNNVYVWLNLQQRGLEPRMVAPRHGHIPIDDMIARIDRRTRIVAVSSTTFVPGFRTDIDTLGRVCRERGIFFLVDAAQSIGVLGTDVQRSCIDGLAVSTQKGLLGLYGMGLLYVRREWAERMNPAYLARFGVDLGNAHEAALGAYEYKLMPGARRFDLGNYNFLATAALNPSLDLLLEIGTDRIEPYLATLSHALAQGFIALGLPVCGGAPGVHLANIVTIGTLGNGGHDGIDDPRLSELAGYLAANKIKFSLRRGLLRFSFHIYNNKDDVERILGLTRTFLHK